MGPFDKYMVLKPNFMKYENQILIWKVILLSCTLRQLPFLCQDYPSRSSLPIKKIGYSGGGGDGLMWSCGDLGTFGFFFRNSIQAFMSTPIKIWRGFPAHLFDFPSSFIIFFVFWVFLLKKKRVKVEPPSDRHTRWASATVAITNHQLLLNRNHNPPSPLQLLHISSSCDFQL